MQNMLHALGEPFLPGPAPETHPSPDVLGWATSRVWNGAIAGFVATGVMTLAMEVSFQVLPREQRFPLEPSEIVQKGVTSVGKRQPLPGILHMAATLLFHFGYGTAAGTAYAMMTSALKLPPLARGLLFGSALWAVGYLGWLPSMHVLRPATAYPRSRIAALLLAHLVWGASAALLSARLDARQH